MDQKIQNIEDKQGRLSHSRSPLTDAEAFDEWEDYTLHKTIREKNPDGDFVSSKFSRLLEERLERVIGFAQEVAAGNLDDETYEMFYERVVQGAKGVLK